MKGNSHNQSSEAAHFYRAAVQQAAPRLLSLLDREALSPTYGSFDREHWAWKFRDFPLGMQQTAVYPVALLWRHEFPGSPYKANERLLGWIFGAIEQTLARQHPNGAFDAFAPNEQDPGPTLGVVHGLLEAWRLVGDQAAAPLADRFRKAVRRACDFAMHREETEIHAFVSNHWALFAVALHDAAELLADPRYQRRAEAVIARILREQSSDGWYHEYGGPDPGYESLGLFHLAVYWQRTGSRELLESLRRSIEFYSYCVHPDGSVGGCYGSRHTSLYFPGAFEILAPQIPAAGSVAAYMRKRLDRGNVLTPNTADAENLPALCYSYLEAARVAEPNGTAQDVPGLPCVSLQGVRHFAHSGLIFAGQPGYYAAVHAKRGGMCRVFDRQEEKIAYEDSGYVIRAGGRQWASQFLGVGSAGELIGHTEVESRAQFCEVRWLIPTPARFLVLRILNLTLFRNLTLNAWLRRKIIFRLMLARRPGPFLLLRKVGFEPDKVRFEDTLSITAPVEVEEVSLPRKFMGIHMGSGKYFHPSELANTCEVSVTKLARELNGQRQARHSFCIDFARETTSERPAAMAAEGIPTR